MIVNVPSARSPDPFGHGERSSPKPLRGAATGAGLTAKPRSERKSACMKDALSSDTVRKIGYKFLHVSGPLVVAAGLA